MQHLEPHTLAYLSYGDGVHVDETIFSILSALHWRDGSGPPVKIVVMTDTPQRFTGLGVTVETISQETLRAWLGPATYTHRRKLEAMKRALARYGGSVALVDGDTWFRQHPHKLFERIAPGKCCMHLLESKLIDSRTSSNKSIADFLAHSKFYRLDGKEYKISPNAAMWNSGVIGLHSSDATRIEESLHLLDQLMPCASSAHTIEQFAVSCILKDMDLKETSDIVFHYWPLRIRNSFRTILGNIITDFETLPLSERAVVTYAKRPQTAPKRQVILWMKRLFQVLHIPVRGVRASG